MASPFPGMDPYLENPGVWPGLHHRLINEAAAQLQEQLNSRGYYVEIGERVWLSAPQRSVYPDIVAVHVPASSGKESKAAALVADEPIRVKRSEFEVREPFLEIYDA